VAWLSFDGASRPDRGDTCAIAAAAARLPPKGETNTDRAERLRQHQPGDAADGRAERHAHANRKSACFSRTKMPSKAFRHTNARAVVADSRPRDSRGVAATGTLRNSFRIEESSGDVSQNYFGQPMKRGTADADQGSWCGLIVESDVAVVRVEDTGIGISAQDLPFIFDRFFRADKVRSRETDGAGLGWLVYRTMDCGRSSCDHSCREHPRSRLGVRSPDPDRDANPGRCRMTKRPVARAGVVVVLTVALGRGSPPTVAADDELFDAIRRDEVTAVQALLTAGADPNARDDIGATALMHAAAFSSPESMRALLDEGAEVHASSTAGATALSSPGFRTGATSSSPPRRRRGR